MLSTSWLEALLWISAVSTLVLNTPQGLRAPTANSSLNSLFSTSGQNVTAFMNQSGQNEASIHCETGSGHNYGHPELRSCKDALENIPQSTYLQKFGDRGAELRGVNGLPYRFISCKLHLYAALSHGVFASVSYI